MLSSQEIKGASSASPPSSPGHSVTALSSLRVLRTLASSRRPNSLQTFSRAAPSRDSDDGKPLRIDPDHRGAICGIAALYHRRGELNDAVEMYRRVLGRAREFDEAWLGLANAYYDSGELEPSLDAYRKFLKYVTKKNRGQLKAARRRMAH